MKKVNEAWNRFFFEPTQPETLGLFRIAFGLIAILSLVGKLPDRAIFYGQHALVTAHTSSLFFPPSSLAASAIKLVPGSDPALLIFFVILLAIALFVTLGAWTRVSSILLFIGLVALSNRGFTADNAGDDLIRLNSFFLMFAPAGAAYSVDRLLKKHAGDAARQISPWGLRLLQLQLAYMYLDTVFLKIHGQAWLDGTAVYYALHYAELTRFSMGWLFHHLWEIRIATWAVLAVETSMATLVWVPRLRYYCLAAALCLHAGMNFALQFPVFEYAMMANLVLFLDPKDVARGVAKLKRIRASAAARVKPYPSKAN